MNYVLAMTLRNSSRNMPLNQINSRITKDETGKLNRIFSFLIHIGSNVAEKQVVGYKTTHCLQSVLDFTTVSFAPG